MESCRREKGDRRKNSSISVLQDSSCLSLVLFSLDFLVCTGLGVEVRPLGGKSGRLHCVGNW